MTERVSVPVEPTEAMVDAGAKVIYDSQGWGWAFHLYRDGDPKNGWGPRQEGPYRPARQIYPAMLAAAQEAQDD